MGKFEGNIALMTGVTIVALALPRRSSVTAPTHRGRPRIQTASNRDILFAVRLGRASRDGRDLGDHGVPRHESPGKLLARQYEPCAESKAHDSALSRA